MRGPETACDTNEAVYDSGGMYVASALREIRAALEEKVAPSNVVVTEKPAGDEQFQEPVGRIES